MRSKRTTKLKMSDDDLLFVFKNVRLDISFDDEIEDDKLKTDVKYAVKILLDEIDIDKSYVEFSDNKHTDTFLTEEGWNALVKLVKKTNYGKNTTPEIDDELDTGFRVMILAYAYHFLEKCGLDIEGVQLNFDDEHGFMTYFVEDTILEWKHYPGPWQDWEV